MRDLDRFRGCLLGGAAGDALGYEVEFMSERQIRERFGEKGITDYCLRNGVAEISDDTQMTMFTATGLLFGTTRGKTRGIMGTYASYIHLSYKDWYRTQTEAYPLPEEYHFSWLVNLPEMFHRRAPGNTCMSALRSEHERTIAKPINNSKGCGGGLRLLACISVIENGSQSKHLTVLPRKRQRLRMAMSWAGFPQPHWRI